MSNLDRLKKSTPETAAKTRQEYARQVLELYRARQLEKKANQEARRPEPEPQPESAKPAEPFNPNKLMKEDNIPF